MMFSSEEVDLLRVDSRLRDLIKRGYRFVHRRDAEGNVHTVVGIRPHHTVVDIIRITDRDSAVATRIPGGEQDIFEPSVVLWRGAGPTGEVLEELLTLPEKPDPCGRRAIPGCWVPGEGGRATWLAATG
ncbi:MAG TPA: hypothetical protein VFG87_23060 [Amycolatopsis sp.]|nr:hypothetical protein [Amycolatopsis sp.]